MKKNDVFTFTAPNGVEVTAVVINVLGHECGVTRYLCYAQNRLFTGLTDSKWVDTGKVNIITVGSGKYAITKEYPMKERIESPLEVQEVLVDYAILPEYDSMLEEYQHQQDMVDDYASKEY